MNKAVSNREICFIKVDLSLCEHGTFFLNFASHGVKSPPTPSLQYYWVLPPILLGLRSILNFLIAIILKMDNIYHIYSLRNSLLILAIGLR